MKRVRTELDEATRLATVMPLADLYELARRVGELANLEQPLLRDAALKRAETIDHLRQAALHLDISDRPLRKKEYEQASREIDVMGWNKIHRIWGSFAVPAAVAAGLKPPQTSRQRDFARKYLPLQRRFRHEECFSAVRRWLATEPFTETATGYDDFVLEYNALLDEGEPTLPRLAYLHDSLGLRFHEIVAIVRGERAPEEVIKESREDEPLRGPYDLVMARTIALLGGTTVWSARQLVRRSDFPTAALIKSGWSMWIREEVVAYLAGERRPLLEEDRLSGLYMTAAEVAERLMLTPEAVLQGSERYVRRAGRVGNLVLYFTEEVEAYVNGHVAEIDWRRHRHGRPTDKAPPRRKFVSLMQLARERGLTLDAMREMTREDGFPAPYRDYGVWLRAAVQAYFAGEELVEDMPPEELMTTAEVNAFLGYRKQSSLGDKPSDFPRPVARRLGGNLFARADIEAYVAAHPDCREAIARGQAASRRYWGAAGRSDRAPSRVGD